MFHGVVTSVVIVWAAMLFGCTRARLEVRGMDAAREPAAAVFEQQRSWGTHGVLVLRINRTRTDLVTPLLLTATLTWDPQWTVYLPDTGLLPPTLAVISEQLQGPTLLDNGSLQAVWTLEVDVLEAGVHMVPELPWVLVERARADREPTASAPLTETVRSPAVPIVAEVLATSGNLDQGDAFEPEPTPPVPVPFASFVSAGTSLFLFLFLLFFCALLTGRDRKKSTATSPFAAASWEEEKLCRLLETVRREALFSTAFQDTSVRAVEAAVTTYLYGNDSARFTSRKGENTFEEDTPAGGVKPQDVIDMLEKLRRFCQWYRFGRRPESDPVDQTAQGKAEESPSGAVSAFLQEVDRAMQALRRHSCPPPLRNERTGASDQPIPAAFTESTEDG